MGLPVPYQNPPWRSQACGPSFRGPLIFLVQSANTGRLRMTAVRSATWACRLVGPLLLSTLVRPMLVAMRLSFGAAARADAAR